MAALHAPLRSVLDHRGGFGGILVLNGARYVADIVYKDEMHEWEEMDRVKVVQTVDPGGETPGRKGKVGLIPNVFEQLQPQPNGNTVVTCGPPIMIHFTMITLDKLGFPPEKVMKEKARVVGRQSYPIDEFLTMLSANGELELEFRQSRNGGQPVLFHGHCHQKAMADAEKSVELLNLAGHQAEMVNAVCCGMAGAFGYEKEHYAASKGPPSSGTCHPP